MEVFKITTVFIILTVVATVAAVFGSLIAYKKGFASGIEHRKQIAEAQFGSAEEKAKAIVAEAEKLADSKKREAMLEAKEENQKLRQELDKEIKERRNEISRQEHRLNQKEETLDKKTDNLEKKEQNLNNKMRALDKKEHEIAEIKQKQTEELERISGLTKEEAKNILVQEIEMSARHDAALLVKEIEQEAKETAEKKAKNIVAMSIQKVAADHVAETTVSVVNLPSDEM
jgi:ribonuclease Y